MKYCKTRDVDSPSIGTKLSAGIDFFVPRFSEEYLRDVISVNEEKFRAKLAYIDVKEKLIILAPNTAIKLPSGIKANISESDYPGFKVAYIANNRSSVADKHQLIAGACVVDEDYQGEIHISVINSSNKLAFITPCMKIIQFVPTLVPNVKMIEVRQSKLFDKQSERSDAGFGSTDTVNTMSSIFTIDTTTYYGNFELGQFDFGHNYSITLHIRNDIELQYFIECQKLHRSKNITFSDINMTTSGILTNCSVYSIKDNKIVRIQFEMIQYEKYCEK